MEKKTRCIRPQKIIRKKRGFPYRKWSDYETTLLVNYIQENDFEKPNGRIFYQTFVQKSHMKIEWSLVKNKIRNIRNLYKKAIAWQKSDAAKNIPAGETMESIINRICPFFDSLKEVFGERINKDKIKCSPSHYNSIMETESTNDSGTCPFIPPTSPPHDTVAEEASTFSPIPDDAIKSETMIEDSEVCTEQSQKHNACNCCLVEVVKMIANYQMQQSEYQKARLELEHKKFDFEKEQAFRELEVRQRELEKNERLQVLEIKSREIIALKELEYKYQRIN